MGPRRYSLPLYPKSQANIPTFDLPHLDHLCNIWQIQIIADQKRIHTYAEHMRWPIVLRSLVDVYRTAVADGM